MTFAAVVVLAGCTPTAGPAPSLSPANIGPIVDSAPYLCELIPEQAFRLASGATETLTSRMDGAWENSGDCRTPDALPNPLGLGWVKDTAEAKQMLENLLAVADDGNGTGPIKLPADLGDGAAFVLDNAPVTNQPYEVIAQFKCGDAKPTLDITMAKISKGRDPIKDLTDFMRIAQKRYGQLFKCTPGQ